MRCRRFHLARNQQHNHILNRPLYRPLIPGENQLVVLHRNHQANQHYDQAKNRRVNQLNHLPLSHRANHLCSLSLSRRNVLPTVHHLNLQIIHPPNH